MTSVITPSSHEGSTGLIPKRYQHARPFFWRAATWQPISCQEPDISATDGAAELRIGTFNRWFESQHAKERNDALISHLEKLDWDMFCLQETTQAFILHAAKHALVRKSWNVSDSTGGTLPLSGYGLFAFYNPKTVEVLSVHNYTLPSSRQLRDYQVSIIRIRDQANRTSMSGPLRIINVHLESPTRNDIASDARAEQLRYLHAVAKQPYNGVTIPTVLLGDLNLIGPEEDAITDALFADTWTMLRPQDPGYTFPSPYHKHDLPPKRIDRILLSDTERSKPVEIDIVIQEPVRIDKFGEVPISDHVGVLASITIDLRRP